MKDKLTIVRHSLEEKLLSLSSEEQVELEEEEAILYGIELADKEPEMEGVSNGK